MLPAAHVPAPRIAALPAGRAVTLRSDVPNADDVNAAVVLYLQLDRPDPSPRARATLRLLTQLLKEPCFSQLRTREQLGYIVFSGLHRFGGPGSCVEGITVRVVSKTTGPDALLERIDAFLASFRAALARDAPPPPPTAPLAPPAAPSAEGGAAGDAPGADAPGDAPGDAPPPTSTPPLELDDAAIAAGAAALATRLREPPKTLGAETSRRLDEIESARLEWRRLENTAAAALGETPPGARARAAAARDPSGPVGRAELLAMFDALVTDSPRRRRLAVLAYPKAGQLARPAADASRAARVFDPTADGAIELEEDDIDEFRRTLALWPSGPAPDDGGDAKSPSRVR